MSFILDALRKSEHERQRQSGPSIAELPVAREDRRLPLALLAIGALLLVNAAVIAFFLWRDGTATAVPAAPPAAAPAAVTAAAPAPPPVAVAEVPAAPAPAPAVAAAPAEVRPLAEEAAVSYVNAPPPPPDPTLLPAAPATPPPAVPAAGAPPSIHQLPPQATAGLPALSMDLHIWADDPARRAVFINGRRYQQGAALAEGPTIEEITRDGAVLYHRGRRFLLPRQ